jgi:hypothetical protein
MGGGLVIFGTKETLSIVSHLSSGGWIVNGEIDLKKRDFVHRCILLRPGSLFVHNHSILSRGHKHILSTVFENIQDIAKF